eukprot:760325-Hanusia_phi.AAC.2
MLAAAGGGRRSVLALPSGRWRRMTLTCHRVSWIRLGLLNVRTYQNIWGNNAGRDPPKEPMPNKSITRNATRSWRLDWEEDGRWVEWRIDEEQQAEHERFRVQMEWQKYRSERGQDRKTLWEEGSFRKSSFTRGSTKWWREQYYEYEYAGSGGVQSMAVVRKACETLGVRDVMRGSPVMGDAGQRCGGRGSYQEVVPEPGQQMASGSVSRSFREGEETDDWLCCPALHPVTLAAGAGFGKVPRHSRGL